MYAIIKEHQDGTVTVPVVADSYGAAFDRARELRDEEYEAIRSHRDYEVDDWEKEDRLQAAWFGLESVGGETIEWYLHQVEEVLG